MTTDDGDPDRDRDRRNLSFGRRPVAPVRWWATAAVLLVPLTLVVWLRPTQRAIIVPRPLTSTYTFDYTADLPATVVYDEPALTFGDPIVRSVVDAVTVTVGYRLAPQVTVVAEAALQTRVVISSSTGWRRVADTAPDVPLDGGEAEAVVEVDFASLDELIDEVATEAGTRGSVAVIVEAEVVAPIELTGLGDPVQRTSATSAGLVFAHGPDVIRLVPPSPAASAGPATGRPATAVDNGSTAGRQTLTELMPVTALEPARVGVGSLEVTVARARAVLTVLLLVTGSVALYNWWVLAGRRRSDDDLAAALVADPDTRLDDEPQAVRYAAIRMGTLPGLMTLAERAGLDVLHHRDADGDDEFFVFDGPNVFLHTVPSRAGIGDLTTLAPDPVDPPEVRVDPPGEVPADPPAARLVDPLPDPADPRVDPGG